MPNQCINSYLKEIMDSHDFFLFIVLFTLLYFVLIIIDKFEAKLLTKAVQMAYERYPINDIVNYLNCNQDKRIFIPVFLKKFLIMKSA